MRDLGLYLVFGVWDLEFEPRMRHRIYEILYLVTTRGIFGLKPDCEGPP
jgi:hypothetical protein